MERTMGIRTVLLALALSTSAYAADEFIDFGDGNIVENPFSDTPAIQEIVPGPNNNICIDEYEAEQRMIAMLVEEGLEPRHARSCLQETHLAGLMITASVFGEDVEAQPYHDVIDTMINVDQDIKIQYHDVINRTYRFLEKNKLTILEDTELLGNYYLDILYKCVDLNMPEKSPH
jgi:hypothetical protein